MIKFRNLVIGGIENKVVNLLLLSILVVAGVFLASMLTQTRMLSGLTEETNERQLSSMTGTTAAVIDTVIVENMDRLTEMEAEQADEMFRELAIRVQMAGEYARGLLRNPDLVPRAPWERPDAARNRTWRTGWGSSPI